MKEQINQYTASYFSSKHFSMWFFNSNETALSLEIKKKSFCFVKKIATGTQRQKRAGNKICRSCDCKERKSN